MIAKLTGLLDSIGEDWVVVDVGGVGYIVFCSSRTLAALPPTGQTVALQIETHVREDHIHLYGFGDAAERDWFRMLTTVQGVGAKVALAIMSALSGDELTDAVIAEDKTTVSRANGVGPKLAQRIVTELKDKVGAFAIGGVAKMATALPAEGSGTPDQEAVSALVNLGFSRMQAVGAVARASQELGKGAVLDDLIKSGLKELSQ
ncbi:MAG TPA: Holliday junction branch migration protein RuvA [Rhodospirillaceae bacterium]|nr:Holliday junction branch migration protein RuvA [Rhodospirillaceae bacterium]HAA92558.1 Holliday junction branch migration protein RuvA [Rhodospirillaceae bacterium]HAT34925.1 Holliday junction branch migration protein RuvA [Rhodospirillaceae bacterium]|tara:strand:+ start:226 stop:837 length:612 start_codon:yes stop_codon:yes gene_type:complete